MDPLPERVRLVAARHQVSNRQGISRRRLVNRVLEGVVVMSDSRYVGVDWASEEHAVCVVDERGRIVEGRRYRHKSRGSGRCALGCCVCGWRWSRSSDRTGC